MSEHVVIGSRRGVEVVGHGLTDALSNGFQVIGDILDANLGPTDEGRGRDSVNAR